MEHPSLNGVGGDEVEDQTVVPLSVTVDATHALFEPVRVPGDVIVEKDVATLKVDTFPRCLGSYQDLDGALRETAVQRRACCRVRHVNLALMLPWMQPTLKPQAFNCSIRWSRVSLNSVKDQQSLVGTVEETLHPA